MKRIRVTTRIQAIALRRLISKALGLPQPSIPSGGGRYDGEQTPTTNHVLARRLYAKVKDADGKVVSATPLNVWVVRIDDTIARIREKHASDPYDSITQTFRARLTLAQRNAFDAAFDTAETVDDGIDDDDEDDDGT